MAELTLWYTPRNTDALCWFLRNHKKIQPGFPNSTLSLRLQAKLSFWRSVFICTHSKSNNPPQLSWLIADVIPFNMCSNILEEIEFVKFCHVRSAIRKSNGDGGEKNYTTLIMEPAVCGVRQHQGSIILWEKKFYLGWYQKSGEDGCCFHLLQIFQIGKT